DAQPCVQTRTDVDGDGADLPQLDLRVVTYELDRRRERLGVAPAPRRVKRREHPLGTAHGAADLHGGRLDPEQDHDNQRFTARSSCAARAAQRPPTGRTRNTLSSSPEPNSIFTSR